MHKRIWLAFIFLVFAAAFTPKTSAENPSWTSSLLSYQKQSDSQSLPDSIYGNIDCSISSDFCLMPTTFGAASFSGSARMAGSNKLRPVISYIDSRNHFLPVLNSDTFITYTTEPAFGVYLYFNYNFVDSIKLAEDNGQSQHQVIKPPDGQLQDNSKNKLAADTNSISFSENGRWMVVSVPNVAVLRVNLQTFEVLPFAPGFNYSLGLDPALKTAITNDGRFAVVASKDFNRFSLYDLDSCQQPPATISGPVACESKDLYSFTQQNLQGFDFIGYVRFLDDETVSAYAAYSLGGTTKTTRFLISTDPLSNQIDYLALGDSYISGEGVFDYQAGTDTDSNKCHLSLISYPYLLGLGLSYNSFHSVACSGALTKDIVDTSPDYSGQLKGLPRTTRSQLDNDGRTSAILASFLPGYINQLDFIAKHQPKIVTISIGGNDMGFAQIVKSCAMSLGSCYDTYEDRYELVHLINNQVFPKLVDTYSKIRTVGPPDMRLFVIGYPQIAKTDSDCGLNVRLNADEVLFSNQLISYLDLVMQAAASKAGAYYVDTQDALNGHRLCEAKPGSIAMNGLTGGNDTPGFLGGPIGNESFHPNDFGHQLLANKILISTQSLMADMPVSDVSASPPTEANQPILNKPHSGRSINQTEYDPGLLEDVVAQQASVNISLDGQRHALQAGSNLQAELHSDPIKLGNFITDSRGSLGAQIIIPADTPIGYHTLHIYGTNLEGQPVDIYKIVYVTSPLVKVADANIAAESVSTSNPAIINPGVSDLSRTKPARVSPASPTQKPAAGSVLSDSIETSPARHFNFWWLLAAIPAAMSIVYFLKQKN